MQILSGEDGASDVRFRSHYRTLLMVLLQASLQRVRDVYEAAIVQLGVDIARGAAIWEAYRDFEEGMLEILLSAGANGYVLLC